MSRNVASEATANADRFYTMVKSLNNFDNVEVKGVIDTLLSKTDEENCFIGTYYRTIGNVATLLEMQNPKHVQAVAMLSRGLFELAVDIRLIAVIQGGWIKMLAFADVEKLRCARKIVKFKTANPNANVDVTGYASFITNKQKAIDNNQRILWPNKNRVDHWSDLKLGKRVALLKAPFEEIYEVDYPRLSWYVHSGLTGVISLKAETFTYICSYAFKLAVDAYWEVLLTVIRKFKIDKANEKIEQKMKAARMLPFTDSPKQAEELLRELLR